LLVENFEEQSDSLYEETVLNSQIFPQYKAHELTMFFGSSEDSFMVQY